MWTGDGVEMLSTYSLIVLFVLANGWQPKSKVTSKFVLSVCRDYCIYLVVRMPRFVCSPALLSAKRTISFGRSEYPTHIHHVEKQMNKPLLSPVSSVDLLGTNKWINLCGTCCTHYGARWNGTVVFEWHVLPLLSSSVLFIIIQYLQMHSDLFSDGYAMLFERIWKKWEIVDTKWKLWNVSKAIISVIIQIIIRSILHLGPTLVYDSNMTRARGYANHLSQFFVGWSLWFFFFLPNFGSTKAPVLGLPLSPSSTSPFCSYKSNFPRGNFITISSLPRMIDKRHKNICTHLIDSSMRRCRQRPQSRYARCLCRHSWEK